MKPGPRRAISFILTILVCLTVVVLAMAWLSGAFRRDQIAPGKLPAPAAAYSGPTFQVEPVSNTRLADLVGSVESESRTTIAPRLTANIVSLDAVAGQTVKKGDVLVRLDDRDLKARVAQAREVLHSAEAARDQAKWELDRIAPLTQSKAASLRELEDWKSRFSMASADVARAQQALNEAEVQLSDTQIVAPFDGVIIDRYVEPGDLASVSKPLLAMYSPFRLRLEAIARESDIGILSQLRKENRPLTVSIPALKAERQGTIEQIVPAADPQSRSFLVKVHLTDTTDLYPGMFGRLAIPVAPQSQLEIPRSAIREVGQVTLVDVVGTDGLASRAVRLGELHGDRVEILAGLEAGEKIALAR